MSLIWTAITWQIDHKIEFNLCLHIMYSTVPSLEQTTQFQSWILNVYVPQLWARTLIKLAFLNPCTFFIILLTWGAWKMQTYEIRDQMFQLSKIEIKTEKLNRIIWFYWSSASSLKHYCYQQRIGLKSETYLNHLKLG